MEDKSFLDRPGQIKIFKVFIKIAIGDRFHIIGEYIRETIG
jgi:hypothetical protein